MVILIRQLSADAMIGDTNLFFNNTEDQCTAEAEIMIADIKSRGKKMGWEAMILMLRYGKYIEYLLYYVNAKFESLRRIWRKDSVLITYVKFVDTGIERLKVERYEVKISMDNEKSIRMFSKLRFHEVI